MVMQLLELNLKVEMQLLRFGVDRELQQLQGERETHAVSPGYVRSVHVDSGPEHHHECRAAADVYSHA